MNYHSRWCPILLFLFGMLMTSPALPPVVSQPTLQLLPELTLERIHASLPPTATPQPADNRPVDPARFEPAWLKQLLTADDDTPLRGIVSMRASSSLTAMSLEGLEKAERGQIVVRTLQEQAQAAQQRVLPIIQRAQQAGQVVEYQPLWIVNAIAVQGMRKVFFDLAGHPDVAFIAQDHLYELDHWTEETTWAQLDGVQWHVRQVQADRVWESLDVDGSSVVIGIMDSGVDWQHPLLARRYRGYTGKPLVDHRGHWYCTTDEGYLYPGDGLGHGTHVAGIALGEGGIGVAPGAQWIAVKAFNNQGLAYESWLHAGFQWLLAPNGDPKLAPHIVNGSWGTKDSTNTVFQNDLRALRAAGIVPVFAAGNEGPGEGTLISPGSLPETIAVGATDRDDRIAWFSARGPSPWNEIKPEVSAPGVDILSALPGGGLGLKSGTSMATPLTAGVIALLLQANPTLTIDEIEAILTQTAFPLGEGRPNNAYGWGRIDAYAATVRAGHFGWINGSVHDAFSGDPIAGAEISVQAHGGGLSGTTISDAYGAFRIGLSMGIFDVTARAFGYQPATQFGVTVTMDTTTTLQIDLVALPTGLLQGTVGEVGTGKPLSATVRVPGTLASTTTDPLDGHYALTLPQGTHTVRVEAWGYRAVTATVTILGSDVQVRDFLLEPAPTILLIDSGAWYNDSRRQFYQRALDNLGYLYDTHMIVNLGSSSLGIPTAEQLAAYDLVIWSAPQDAPGYIGAGGVITNYLSGGGRLLLSGQDVAYWDGGGSGLYWSSYLYDYLKTAFVADTAPSTVLTGSGFLEGLSLSITGGEGADNQISPDVIAPAERDFAHSVLDYQDDGSGGLAVGPCLPYRALVLGFGLEGISSDTMREAVLERGIRWLTGPLQGAGVELQTGEPTRIGRPGDTLTYTVRLRNLSEIAADSYVLELSGYTWPTMLLISQPVVLSTCATLSFSLAVTIPSNTGWNISDTAALRATSTVSPALTAAVSLTTKTPAPLLLVDGARFFDVSTHYIDALNKSAIPYDYIRVKVGWPLNVPTTDTLAMYPLVLWYTAYDWYEPISEVEDERLRAFLDGGGRLLLSSQDFLYHRHDTPLAETYLGVREHIEDLTPQRVWGEWAHPIGWGLGPYSLTFTYTNWSDGLIPLPSARAFLRAETGNPVALNHNLGHNWRTIFASFPLETLDADAASVVISRAVGWLSWLGLSEWGGWPGDVRGGDSVSMSALLFNDGPTGIVSAFLTTTIPPGLTLLPATMSPELTYDPLSRQVSWQGSLASWDGIKLWFDVQVDGGLPNGTLISFPAWIGYADHGITFERPFFVRVGSPNLLSSTLQVQPSLPVPRQVLTCTLAVRNGGTLSTIAMVTSYLTTHAQFTGTLESDGVGTGTVISNLLTWDGPVTAGQTVNLRYRVALDRTGGYVLPLHVWVVDEWGGRTMVETYLNVDYIKIYLPLAFKSFAK